MVQCSTRKKSKHRWKKSRALQQRVLCNGHVFAVRVCIRVLGGTADVCKQREAAECIRFKQNTQFSARRGILLPPPPPPPHLFFSIYFSNGCLWWRHTLQLLHAAPHNCPVGRHTRARSSPAGPRWVHVCAEEVQPTPRAAVHSSTASALAEYGDTKYSSGVDS